MTFGPEVQLVATAGGLGPSDGPPEVNLEYICHPHQLTTASSDGKSVSAIGPSNGCSVE